jgi:hypothetical protein
VLIFMRIPSPLFSSYELEHSSTIACPCVMCPYSCSLDSNLLELKGTRLHIDKFEEYKLYNR